MKNGLAGGAGKERLRPRPRTRFLPVSFAAPGPPGILLSEPGAPLGLKGVGEPPSLSSTPAIVSALRAATGRRLPRVPVRPDGIVFGEPVDA